MYQMKKHTLVEVPPSGRFFGKQVSKPSPHATKADAIPASEVCGPRIRSNQTMSPAKRVSLRTQCIEQLEMWHQLMEKGGITKEQIYRSILYLRLNNTDSIEVYIYIYTVIKSIPYASILHTIMIYKSRIYLLYPQLDIHFEQYSPQILSNADFSTPLRLFVAWITSSCSCRYFFT